MRSESALLSLASLLLLLFTVATAAVIALRQRDRQRTDLFLAVFTWAFVVALIKLSIAFTGGGLLFLSSLVLFLQPYFLLRLVQHFRQIPRLLRWSVLTCTTLGTLVTLALPRPRPTWLGVSSAIYFLICQGYAAWSFTVEAHASTGVTSRRLALAAVGAWILPVMSILAVASYTWPALERSTLAANNILALAMILAYYLGLTTPRFLRRSWQRIEVYRFLCDLAEAEPADGESRAAVDLSRAASQSVAASATLVLLGRDQLKIRAASQAAWQGLVIASDVGLVGQARLSGDAVTGALGDCEPRLAALIASVGSHLVAVPIRSRGDTWGVLLVVQRYGSLFPDDDVELLVRLCRYTADTLGHARLAAEERARQQHAADARVRESESRLRMMLESITDYAMITLGGDGRVTGWNVGAEHVFGYSAAEIIGVSAVHLFDERVAPFAMDLAGARGGQSVNREGACWRRDGTSFLGSSVIRTLRHAGQDTEGFVVVTRDVTEHRQLEARLRQGQKMEALGRLAGGVAHDFNNLLTVILGYTAILESDRTTPDNVRSDITEIRHASERAAALTRQLLSFSRQQVLQPRVVSVPEIIRGLLPMLTRVLGEQIDVIDILDEDVQPVLVDAGELEQIVINLAVNARDAMPSGGRLTIRAGNVQLDDRAAAAAFDIATGAYTMLEVDDTGTGMDATTKARIFEPFFTTKEFGRGTGLGLSTVYGLVRQRGGGIAVESELGQGTHFKVYLPHATVASPAGETAPASTAAGETGGSETVLLVEDEASVRALLASMLMRSGYRVLQAVNPTEATQFVATHTGPLDIIITDVVMPGGTGPDLVRALSADRPNLKVLYISGYAEASIGSEANFTLGTNFLQKPFTGPQLLDKVRQVLNH